MGQVVLVQYGIETEGTNTSNSQTTPGRRQETRRLRGAFSSALFEVRWRKGPSERSEHEQSPGAEEERVDERVVDGLAIGGPRHQGEHNWMLRRRRRDFG
jgi:hypothetical protein